MQLVKQQKYKNMDDQMKQVTLKLQPDCLHIGSANTSYHKFIWQK